jgi:hypothetical protein
MNIRAVNIVLGTLALFVTSALGQSASPGTPCVLVAGVGCGNLTLEKTRRNDFLSDDAAEARFAHEGVTFTFNASDKLDSIVVVGNKLYKTDKGVSTGDKESRVLQAYGKPTRSGKMVLYKGQNEPIGRVGDRALIYPGILFIISRGTVWAISINTK